MNPYTLREFIEKATQGTIGPSYPIRVRNACGDQINELSFEDCGKRLCQSHGLDPISLYHAIQQGINSEMIQRLNRSQTFRKKVQAVVCDEWGNCELSDMFSDNLDEPYDQTNADRENQVATEIREALQRPDEIDPNDMRAHLTGLRERCNTCLGNVRQGQIKLNEDYDKYQPNYADSWKSLSMKHYPYYLQTINDSNDPKHQAFAEKQLKRAIPEQISNVFANGDLLPTLMRKENRVVSQRLRILEESLTEDLQKLNYLIDSLPESSKGEEAKGLIADILGKLGITIADSDDEEPPPQPTEVTPTIQQMVQEVVDDEEDDNDEEDVDDDDEDDDDDEEDIDDEDHDTQMGGKKQLKPMYHLSFF